jgi:hypothetical protein
MIDFVYLKEPEEYLRALSYLEPEPDPACDVETHVLQKWRGRGGSALDPHTGRISLLTLKGRGTVPHIFDILELERRDYDRRPMYEYLRSRKKLLLFQSQFDLKFLFRHYGVFLRNAWDVRLMAKLIGNATGSKYARQMGHTLADVSRDWLDVHVFGKGSEQVSDWYPRPLTQEKLQYAASDVMYLHDLHDMMLPVIINPLPVSPLNPNGADDKNYGLGMARTLDLEMKMCSVAAEMEYNGLPVSAALLEDIQRAIKDEETLSGRLYEVASELCEILGLPTEPCLWTEDRIPSDAAFKTLNNPVKLKILINQHTRLNLDSSQTQLLTRLLDLLAQIEEKGEPDFVDDDEQAVYGTIANIEESVALAMSKTCSLIVEYKKLQKLYSMDLRSYVNPCTGCIHSHLDMLGAATGRSSGSNPNPQNISARTYIEIERPFNDLFPSSANYDQLLPDWNPFAA